MKTVFLILLVSLSVLIDSSQNVYGTTDFFQKHGYLFLVSIAIFPRLTLLFSSVATGGFIWWIGFIFCPRVLVASLATVTYFHTNPILVVISWVVAIGGEVMEKKKISNNRFAFRFHRPMRHAETQSYQPIDKNDAIEAEFIRKE